MDAKDAQSKFKRRCTRLFSRWHREDGKHAKSIAMQNKDLPAAPR